MFQSKFDLREKYFYQLNTQDLCKKALKEVAECFYFIGGLSVVISFLPVSQVKGMWIDGCMYLILALFLHFKQSRVSAVLLIMLSGGALIMTILNKMGITSEGGNNIYLSIISFISAVRGTQASFCFQKLKQQSTIKG